MTKKIKRTLAAALAAITMTTAMASTAGAESGTWKMWKDGSTCSAQDKIVTSSVNRNYLSISCPNFSTSYYNGQPAHVRYWSFVATIKTWDDEEVVDYVIPGGFGSRYFYRATSTMNVSFTTTFIYGDYLYLKLRLEDYENNTCEMSGSFTL